MRGFVQVLKNGGVGVLMTDTIYGVLGSAFNKVTIERIYKIRKRNTKKPFIILISSIADLRKFNIFIDRKSKNFFTKIWPGRVSVVFKAKNKAFSYLHRGTRSLAFRIPKSRTLLNILKKTGPLAAPSANPEGARPAKSILEAKKYFGNSVDFYLRGSANREKPSSLISFDDGKITILRRGTDYEKISKYFKTRHA